MGIRLILSAGMILAHGGNGLAQDARPVPGRSREISRETPALPSTGASDELADPKTGCRIVRADREPDTTISWSGECYHGLADGNGVLQWYQAGKPIARYEGQMKDGLANGRGSITYANGSRYEGDWSNGERNGRGTFVFANGAKYTGDFRDNRPNGRGMYVWPNGNRYIGEFRENQRTGQGTLYYANGDRYQGEFVDGKAQGRGIRTFAAGGRYEGEWRNDLPNGYGTSYGNGQNYSGYWRDGCFRDGQRWATVGVTAQQCGYH
ncbi:MORN repeat-containing protein [Reyranella sp.]|uniref:MORN repeat-containing protein n=1 Tax=Reyranella sp. TaxID=1929291 RepID=UPI003BA9978D